MFIHHFHNLVHQYLVTGLHCNFFHFILLLLSPAEFVTQQFAIGYQVGNSLFQQFRVERFHHISIGTGFHPFQSIFRFGLGCQQDYRNMIYISVLLYFTTQSQSVHFGHHNIGDNQIGRITQNRIIRFLTVAASLHFVFIR